MRYSVEGLPYSEACKLLDQLKIEGIDANITTGGIAVFPQNDKEVETARKISKDFGAASFSEGGTFHQKSMTLKTQNL
jgi:hypothetical protein